MSFNRRNFIKTSLGAALLSSALRIFPSSLIKSSELFSELEKIALKPVLQTDVIKEPVIIESLELLKTLEHFIVRARSKDGAER